MRPQNARPSRRAPHWRSRRPGSSQAQSGGKAASRSGSLDERIDHLLLPGLVEIDGELVAVDMRHVAIAEFLVKHSDADLDPRAFGRARRDQRPVDGDGLACAGRSLLAAARAIALRALPARCLVEARGEQILRGVEPARTVAAEALVLGDFDVIDRQLVDEARWQRLLPRAVIAPDLGEGDLGVLPCARQSHMGEPALLLEPGA